MKTYLIPISLWLILVSLSSCIGVSADVRIAQNGSGTISLEYRLATFTASLGAMDGNWPILPVGKTDMERTCARVPGLTLQSYAVTTEAAASGTRGVTDTVYRIRLGFDKPETLVRFFDATGQHAVLVRDTARGGTSLVLTLVSGGTDQHRPDAPTIDPDLLQVVQDQTAGYTFHLGFSAAGRDSSLTFVALGSLNAPDSRDTQGSSAPRLPEGTVLVPQGADVSCTVPIGALLACSQTPGGVQVAWHF